MNHEGQALVDLELKEIPDRPVVPEHHILANRNRHLLFSRCQQDPAFL